MTPPSPAAGPARGARRRIAILLAALLVATALLRLWYLPSSARLDSETPAIENVQAVFADSEIRDHRVTPLAWTPQLWLVRAADRLRELRGAEGPRLATVRHKLTRRGLELARHFSVLYGTAGVLVLFLVGRRLHTPAVGLLAAAILAFSPWHIQGSVAFAPDILVLTLSLLALWLGMRALDRPLPARFALVGLALGGAAAAKLSGALVALPVLAALVLAGGREWWRKLLPLAVAGPVAALTWWLLSPPLELYAEALEIEQAVQVKRAVREMSSRFTVAVFGLLHPLRDSVHGALLGTLALLGAAGQACRCLFLLEPGPDRAHRLMVLAAWPVFAVGYAWATPLFRESGFVPLVAYSSLYAAVMLAILWRGAADSVTVLRSAWARPAAALLALALFVPAGWSYVYSSAVRSTASVAVEWLRKELGGSGPRLVLVERAALAGGGDDAMQLAGGFGLQPVDRLARLDGVRLARADASIFLRRELDGDAAKFYRDHRRSAVRHRPVESRLLSRRGHHLVVALHPHRAEPLHKFELVVETREKRRLVIVPAAAAETATISLVVRLPPTREEAPAPPRAWLGETEVDLAPAGLFPRDTLFVSERLPGASEHRAFWLEPPAWMAARRGKVSVSMYAWR